MPLACSLSMYPQVFFQSSILSCNGVTKQSIRALQSTERNQRPSIIVASSTDKVSVLSYASISPYRCTRQAQGNDSCRNCQDPIESRTNRAATLRHKSYLVKVFIFASMLRCRSTIRVKHLPISLVAPETTKIQLCHHPTNHGIMTFLIFALNSNKSNR